MSNGAQPLWINRPEYGSGPHLALVSAMVGLAIRDLADPNHSEEARAFLEGRPYRGYPTEIDVDLFADLLGYEGSFIRDG